MLGVICFNDQLPTLLDSSLQMEFAYGYIRRMDESIKDASKYVVPVHYEEY